MKSIEVRWLLASIEYLDVGQSGDEHHAALVDAVLAQHRAVLEAQLAQLRKPPQFVNLK